MENVSLEKNNQSKINNKNNHTCFRFYFYNYLPIEAVIFISITTFNILLIKELEKIGIKHRFHTQIPYSAYVQFNILNIFCRLTTLTI